MPKTNKKEQPECNPSTSAFLLTRKTIEPLLKVAQNIDGREGNDSSTKLPKTRNDRTRICSVTITPYPNVFLLLQCHFLIASAKVILFSEPTKFFSTFLSKIVIFFIFMPFRTKNTWFCAIPTLKKQKSWRKVTHTHFFALSL